MTTPTKVWILTNEFNEYDQWGEYFLAAFANKPTHFQLSDYGVPTNRLHHVLRGGGRVKFEHEWFHLRHADLQDAA